VTPTSVSIPTLNQSKRFVFAGFQGQNLGLGIANIQVPGAGNYAELKYTIYDPTGASLTAQTCNNGNGEECGPDLSNLAYSGYYSMDISVEWHLLKPKLLKRK
jgi:hypothetical protein